jgi:hypothetical protein
MQRATALRAGPGRRDFFGRECRHLDIPALIRVKRAAGLPKDLETVAELEALHEESR